MALGSFALVLHSHLPYYRKAGMWPFGEENLYEAIAETYLPLLEALHDLLEEGIQARITLGLTPILLEQLGDAHCLAGFERYVEAILERLDRDLERYSPEGEVAQASWERGEALARLREALSLEQAARGEEAALAAQAAGPAELEAWEVAAGVAKEARRLALSAEEPEAEGLLALARGAAALVQAWERARAEQQRWRAAHPSLVPSAPPGPGLAEASVGGAAPKGAQAPPAALAAAEAPAGPAPAAAQLGLVGAVVAPGLAGPPGDSDAPQGGTLDDEGPSPEEELAAWLASLDGDLAERYRALATAPLEERPEDPRRQLAPHYQGWYQARLAAFRQRFGRDLVGAFRQLQEAGAVEIITSAATHGFSPLLGRDSALKAQISVGAASYRRHFGKDPVGIWLPECAYRPGLDTPEGPRPGVERFLFEEGLRYFFTDAHAVTGGSTAGYRRQVGLYGAIEYVPMPQRPLTGLTTYTGYWLPDYPVAYYARNDLAGYQVWSADRGYPGEPSYREFHKRDGGSGMKYWKVTGPQLDLADKAFYDPKEALDRVHDHADHYVGLLHELLRAHAQANGGETGVVVVPFDTELFGHWWFEGVAWIKELVRRLAQGGQVERKTVGQLLAEQPPELAYQLPESTWGEGGHYHVWLNPKVEFMWPIIHRCEREMELLVERWGALPDALTQRALTQAARELLLLEGSDWPFLVTTGQAKAYAIERFRTHVARFEALAEGLWAQRIDEEALAEAEAHDNPFPELALRWWRERQGEGAEGLAPKEA